MSSHPALLLYLLLEQGSLHDNNGVLFRPLCDEGKLQPPLVAEARAQQDGIGSSRSKEEPPPRLHDTPLAIEFSATDADTFTLRVPPAYFATGGLNAESCFGAAASPAVMILARSAATRRPAP
jgi:hypothetical protein